MSDFRLFRQTVNRNRRKVVDFISVNYVERADGRSKDFKGPGICFFCGSDRNITREHVIPRWAFDRDPGRWFTTMINGLRQSYEQSTVPCCGKCNSAILNEIEKNVNGIFTDRDVTTNPLSDAEMEAVIAWFELIDYKFQVISVTRRFVAYKESGFIRFLSDFPISVLDPAFDYSPAKVLKTLRATMRQMGVRSKIKRLNSLIVFKTHNPSFYFFNKLNDFIYLEMPHKGVALLYFFTRQFDTVEAARDAALEKIKENY
jgi:hypothetical protein